MATVVNFVEPCARKPMKDTPPSRKSTSGLATNDIGPKDKSIHHAISAIKGDSFDEMKRSVLALGASGKSYKERMQIEEQKLVKLGCAPRKKPKTPLPILKAMKIKHKKKERARKLEAQEADIIAASSVGKRRKPS